MFVQVVWKDRGEVGEWEVYGEGFGGLMRPEWVRRWPVRFTNHDESLGMITMRYGSHSSAVSRTAALKSQALDAWQRRTLGC